MLPSEAGGVARLVSAVRVTSLLLLAGVRWFARVSCRLGVAGLSLEVFRPMRNDPSDNVCDLLRRQRILTARNAGSPISRMRIGMTRHDQAAQSLVADERQVIRIDYGEGSGIGILNRFELRVWGPWQARTVVTVAARASSYECFLARGQIRCCVRGIGRKIEACELRRPRPLMQHALHKRIDLLIGEHAASTLREGRHQGLVDAVCGCATQVVRAGDGKICGIIERQCRTAATVRPVATRAVLAVKHVEVEDLIWTRDFSSGARVTGRSVACCACDAHDARQRREDTANASHSCRSFLFSCSPSSGPPISMPARTANGKA